MIDDALPSCAALAAEPVTHRYEDMFNLPGLTNFLGAVQVDHDVMAVRSVNFAPWSHGDTVTAQLFLDGRLARSYCEAVAVQWRPDHVVRETTIGELELRTVTACPPDATGVVVDLHIRNRGPARLLRVGLALASTVTGGGPWREPLPPHAENTMIVDVEDQAVVGRPADVSAASVQRIDRPVHRIRPDLIEVEIELPAGGTGRVGYVHVVGGSAPDVLAEARRLAADVPAAISAATTRWDTELAAAFTPGNNRFSGCLPRLHTDNEALRRLYWIGAVGVLCFRRDSAASRFGRTYDTLMPRYWQGTTFIWDFMLSSVVHSMLDPEPMREQLSRWINVDIHTHFGTEWQAGSPIGYWYSVNDYAMTRLVRDYVRFTGDVSYLETRLAAADGAEKPVAEHAVDWARAWQTRRGSGGLADYGGIDNLLECVSSYVHEVASFNATNVWALRAAAELVELGGQDGLGSTLRGEADDVARLVQRLYVQGGWWRAGQPDGSQVEVRHCLDFASVASAMTPDLAGEQRAEMVEFFVRELQTSNWMRALSPYDPDAAFSLRPDHQWNGAYTAWPAEAARALFDLGRADVAIDWLPGLAQSANQGPFGQAHFVDDAAPPVRRGARKAPPQAPYLIDWACSSSGAYVGLVLEKVFGLHVPLTGEPSAHPRLHDLDPNAKLTGVMLRGREYEVSANGLRAVDA